MTDNLSDIRHSYKSNPKPNADQAEIADMTERLKGHHAQLEGATALRRQIALTQEELGLRRQFRTALASRSGMDASLVDALRASRRRRLHDIFVRTSSPHTTYSNPPLQMDRQEGGSLDMWWAQTSWWSDAPGIQMSWQDDGLHYSGNVHLDSDDLHFYTISVVAQFALGSDRIPPSARGQVVSTPMAHLYGFVYGVCKDIAMFNFDDQWAKCWLTTRQSVWVKIPGLHLTGSSVFLWGSNTDTRTLMFLEGIDYRDSYLPGLINMPPVPFDLRPEVESVQIDLEFRFDLQLEGGDSDVGFGQARDWPSNLIQTPQWRLHR